MRPDSKSSQRWLLILVALSIVLASDQLFAQTVVINEVMASNSTNLADEDGEYSDWIELYNPGSVSVNLTGFGLSDDLDEPLQWTLPALHLAPKQFLLIFASGKNRRESLGWQTIIDWGDRWKYWPGRSEPAANWRKLEFNDASWSEGPSGFGFGDGDDATIVAQTTSVYLRKKFTLADVKDVAGALLHVDYDDGFVAYLNDVEIARANLGLAGDHPAYNQSTHTYREAQIYTGGLPEQFVIANFPAVLRTGENILAIQVHNYGSQSSDLSLIPFLTLGFKSLPADPNNQVAALVRKFLPNLHTNFKVSASGETVVLADANGKILDQLDTGYLPGDVSRGRQPDGGENWLVFVQPTPGSANVHPGYPDFVAAPEFSAAGGFYAGVGLTLKSQHPGEVIRYTLDGSEPTESSFLYSSPITIAKTTVVRARAFSAGKLPSPIVTQTYFINENISLPVVSLTTHPPNLWDYQTGIYVLGPNAQPDNPYFGANFWQDWEKPVHMEFFEPGGGAGFQMNAGLKIYGAWSRAFPQKSVALYARGQYGAKEIKYAIFPELPFDSFQTIVLRNSGNDWYYTMFRDGLMQTLVKNSHIDILSFRPAVVFLNGAYWGIMNLREKINEHYLASHWQVDPDQLDMLENDAEIIHGSNEHYLALVDFINKNDLKKPENFEYVRTQIDLENYLDYMVAEIYFCNTDWPGNNLKFWRPATPSGKWRWILFDTDFGFGLYDAGAYRTNMIEFATRPDGPEWPNPPWSTLLFRKLLTNDDFRIAFINRCADHLNTTFDVTRVTQMIDAFQNLLKPEMARHQTRWGGVPSGWSNNIQTLKTFASARPGFLRAHLLSYFHLEGMVMVTLDISEPGNGKIRLNSQTLANASWYGHYFKNIPIRLTAIPEPGFKFTGWSGTVTSDSLTLTLVPSAHIKLTANFNRDDAANAAVVVNEIMYKAPDNADPGDWVELYNPTATTIDLGGWKLKDDDNSHIFTLPGTTRLLGMQYLVLCRDTSAFKAIYPAVNNYLGNFDFGLGRGDQVRLFNAANQMIDSVGYGITVPWPPSADGLGASLELKAADLDNGQAENWSASLILGGTPGTKNSIVTQILTPDNQGQQFSLAQNYPNPFNATTLIRYFLPERRQVQLLIFNLKGELVRTLVNEPQTGPEHQVIWDGKDSTGRTVASGIYFVQFQAGDFYQTRPMVFLR